VSQHFRSFVQASIQQRFHELLPAFLQFHGDQIGAASMGQGQPVTHWDSVWWSGCLQWFCSCAGRERMGSPETALIVLTSCRIRQDVWPCHAVLAASGEPPAALDSSVQQFAIVQDPRMNLANAPAARDGTPVRAMLKGDSTVGCMHAVVRNVAQHSQCHASTPAMQEGPLHKGGVNHCSEWEC
jgi:hypothetical protein